MGNAYRKLNDYDEAIDAFQKAVVLSDEGVNLATRARFSLLSNCWKREERIANLHKIAVNTRFLILPWVSVPHLASHLLGQIAKRISRDWERVYHHPLVWLETFVDPARGFKGTCYRAAGWLSLGLTTGRGKNDQTGKANRSLKHVFGYPVVKDFRRALYGLL